MQHKHQRNAAAAAVRQAERKRARLRDVDFARDQLEDRPSSGSPVRQASVSLIASYPRDHRSPRLGRHDDRPGISVRHGSCWEDCCPADEDAPSRHRSRTGRKACSWERTRTWSSRTSSRTLGAIVCRRWAQVVHGVPPPSGGELAQATVLPAESQLDDPVEFVQEQSQTTSSWRQSGGSVPRKSIRSRRSGTSSATGIRYWPRRTATARAAVVPMAWVEIAASSAPGRDRVSRGPSAATGVRLAGRCPRIAVRRARGRHAERRQDGLHRPVGHGDEGERDVLDVRVASR